MRRYGDRRPVALQEERVSSMRIWPTKRWWKRIGIGFATLLAIALIANGFMAWRTNARLQNKIAAIRAIGDPASLADLAPKPIPDNENAAAILSKIGPRLEDFSHEYARFLDKSPVGKAYDARTDHDEPATVEQIEAIRVILNKYSDITAGLAAAAACDKYASMADYSIGYEAFINEVIKKQASRFRTAGRFLSWRMEEQVATQQQNQAVATGIEMLRLARQYDGEPVLVNALVAIAVRGIASRSIYDALAAGPVSPEMHAALDHELALADDPQRMLQMLKTERAYSIDASMAMPSQVSPGPKWLFRMFGWPLLRIWIGELDFLDNEVEIAARPSASALSRVERMRTPLTQSGHGVLADLMIPGLQAAYHADARDMAVTRSLRIYNALRGYAEKNGHEAAGLDELALPREATVDPYSGQPLKLKHTEDGWFVYSVMQNGADDGGDFMGFKDFGVAPRRHRDTDKQEPATAAGTVPAEQKQGA
jgi:hypothetical protein